MDVLKNNGKLVTQNLQGMFLENIRNFFLKNHMFLLLILALVLENIPILLFFLSLVVYVLV